MSKRVQFVQVGGGSVFRERYVPGVRALLPDVSVEFSDLIDVLPEAEIRQLLEPLGLKDFRYHRLLSDNPTAFRDLLMNSVLSQAPIVIASPGPLHSSQLTTSLDCGRFVAVEKPIVTRRESLEALEQRLRPLDQERLFIFSYYLIEKGLPMTLLARRGVGTPVQLHCVSEPNSVHWRNLRERLGGIRGMLGVLVEGVDHRTWLWAENSGGQTLETFSHLAALCCIWCDDVEVLEARLGKSVDVATAAETLTWTRLVGNGHIPIELFCAKWASRSACQRWFEVRFEHGYARMDLEAETLRVVCDGQEWSCSLLRRAKYETQFRQLLEKLSDPSIPVEYTVTWRAADLALRVRDAGFRFDMATYDDNLAPFVVPSADSDHAA